MRNYGNWISSNEKYIAFEETCAKFHGKGANKMNLDSCSHKGDMPIVNIVTTIRQSADYVPSFLGQVSCLLEKQCLIGTINIVHDNLVVEPSSKLAEFGLSDRRARLIPEKLNDINIQSIEEKAKQWASIANQGLESALSTSPSHILWIEADLCFPLDLLDQLVSRKLDVIAPVVYLGTTFYDSWGFRNLAGKKISNFPSNMHNSGPIELSSVGSCVLFSADIFRSGTRFRGDFENGLLVGVCANARALGFRVWADPSISIVHPTSIWRQQVWKISQMTTIDPLGRKRTISNIGGMVPGFYENFIMEWVRRFSGSRKLLSPGVYDLTIIRDPKRREISLVFTAQPSDGPFGQSVKLSGRCEHVVVSN